LSVLAQEGFKLTQATLSRDLHQLRVVKTVGLQGRYRYVLTRPHHHRHESTKQDDVRPVAAQQDNSGLLAVVNGVKVPIGPAYDEYQYYAMMYAYYGYGEADIAELRQQVADYYIDLELIRQQYEKLGLDKDLDREALRAEAEAEYEIAAHGYLTYVDDEGMTEEQALNAARAMLNEDGYTVEYFEQMMYDEICLNAVLEYYVSDVEVTEEDVRAYYDELVAQDKQLVEEDPGYYDVMTGYGERVMYVPEGLRAVKHILIMLTEEQQMRVRELQTELEQVEAGLSADPENAELLSRRTQINQELDQIYATIEPTVNEVMQKLNNGEDFIALMEQYGEDPGMKNEPYKTQGYFVQAESVQWIIPFRDAAMALEKPGDISAPVRAEYGIHIIRYEYDVPAGGVDYDALHDELYEEVFNEKFNAYITELLEQWRSESEIEVYLENLDA
jgi:parvulin-like peptidyl-prolyl isomerase